VTTYAAILWRKIQVHVNKKTYRHFSEAKSVREGCFQQNRSEFCVRFWRASGVGKQVFHKLLKSASSAAFLGQIGRDMLIG